MGRIADLLVRIRDSLGDVNEKRWSDDRLLRLINEAQRKIAKRTGILRGNTLIKLVGLQAEYSLPDYAYFLSRVTNSDGKEIDLKSHSEMDEIDPYWETRTGGSTVTYIIYDKQNPKWFKIYPIIDQTTETPFLLDDYGVVATSEDDIVTPDYGVVADINSSVLEGVIFNSDYGVVTGMSVYEGTLKVYFTRKPEEINAIDIAPSVLEIDTAYDLAMKHYVVGMALRDNQDTQDRTVGSEELQLFTEEYISAFGDSSRNFIKKQPRRTHYNGIG